MGKILVTGGAGFIGSHTAVSLLENGYDIIVMDNFFNSCPAVIERIKQITGREFDFYETDMLDKDGMRKIFKENYVDAVIHFAGYKAVGESVEKPMMYYNNNICGTIALLEVMDEAECKKIVFSSSATVYGMNNPVPYKEDMPTSATNPYGYTKVMIEQILRDKCAAEKDFCAVLLRYFNPIGAHKSGLIGENPRGIPNNLLPYIAQVAVGKREHLSVFGNDYDTPDGTGVRDYIHVCDLADGHLKALKYAESNVGAQMINLGTGMGSSVLDVLHSFEKACGKALPYVIAPRRAGDIAVCYADTQKAKTVLGWEAKHTLDEMTADGWNFTLENPDGIS